MCSGYDNGRDTVFDIAQRISCKGGWTLIKQAKLNSTSPHQYGRFVSSEYQAISNSRDIRQMIETAALQQLRLPMGFHQIRFRCHKYSTGRTFHIMTNNDTAGHKVLDHFLITATWPTACGSFVRLPDDTSILSRNCDKWGSNSIGVNRWGREGHHGAFRIYNLPIFWENKLGVRFDSIQPYHCDDIIDTVSVGDIWELYFR
ncbi:hypothetical protein AC249_AIPGENE7229 [Exaiptasia diaphana]|nr:hypothetical protein AC249_AIPGENE7229 [Exaiptasia diaphana]